MPKRTFLFRKWVLSIWIFYGFFVENLCKQIFLEVSFSASHFLIFEYLPSAASYTTIHFFIWKSSQNRQWPKGLKMPPASWLCFLSKNSRPRWLSFPRTRLYNRKELTVLKIIPKMSYFAWIIALLDILISVFSKKSEFPCISS